MYLTIQGIVLRVTDYNDKDALLTMLTRRHGRLTRRLRSAPIPPRIRKWITPMPR